MKFLRVTVFAALVGYAFGPSAYAQANQPARNQNPSAPPTTQTPGAPQPFSLAPAQPPGFQPPAKQSDDFHLLVQFPYDQGIPPQGDLDPGIYMGKLAGREVCASIISYNFSPGDHPQFESVTTCTSPSMTNALRTRGKGKKPATPLFRTTDLKTLPPQ